MTKPTCTFTYGLPGSGKTTAIQPLIEAGAKRVSLDDLRLMFKGDPDALWDQAFESTVQKTLVRTVETLVAGGFDVVVDNTHVNPHIPTRLRQALAGKVTWNVVDRSNVPMDICIQQDLGRLAGNIQTLKGATEATKYVGAEAIRKLQQKMASHQRNGYHLSVEWLEDFYRPEPYVPDLDKPMAIIVDVDGTLAKNVSRGPYDTSRYDEDEYQSDVGEIVMAARNYYAARIIVCSGRSDEFRRVTEQWLGRHWFFCDTLIMRPAGDTRRDSIVKAELFDKYVRPYYHVVAVFDDRASVIRECWRAMGLRCYAVAEGDF